MKALLKHFTLCRIPAFEQMVFLATMGLDLGPFLLQES
jgi:hypothetical protein